MTTNLTYPVDIADSKESMKTFFAEQTEFTDYNFEGSATSQLMNVLAYAHQSLIYYLNQTVNDLTLKNAEIQDNIRKLSDMLNYLPKRNSAPYISVDLSRSASHTINIPAFSTWTMGSLSLVNVEDITIADDDTHTVQLYEGTLTNETFYSDGTIFQTFDLTNVDKVDNDFFYVFVDESDGAGGYNVSSTAWSCAQRNNNEFETNSYYLNYFDVLSIKFDSYIKEGIVTIHNGLFNVPPALAKIRVEYLLTSGSQYNGTTGTITLNANQGTNVSYLKIDAGTNVLINGTDAETVDEIKVHAPLFYTTQGRAITENDYVNTIRRWENFNILFDAIAWGGEKEYIDEDFNLIESFDIYGTKDLGYVYISALNSDLSYITELSWTSLKAFLTLYKIININFKFLDPVFFYITPVVNLKWSSIAGVSENPSTIINTYLSGLKGYNSAFYLSELVSTVSAMKSVVYNEVEYTTHCVVRHTDYKVIRLNNWIAEESLTGTINGHELTSGTAVDNIGDITWDSTVVGTIDYATGFITLETTFDGLTSDDTYILNFELHDMSHVTVAKETFLRFNDVTVNYI